jgi:hypothetical protein
LASDKRDAALANWGDDILFVAVGRECTLYRRLP